MSVHIVTNMSTLHPRHMLTAQLKPNRVVPFWPCAVCRPPALVAFQTLPSTHSFDMTFPIEQSKRAICCLKIRLRARSKITPQEKRSRGFRIQTQHSMRTGRTTALAVAELFGQFAEKGMDANRVTRFRFLFATESISWKVMQQMRSKQFRFAVILNVMVLKECMQKTVVSVAEQLGRP